MRGMISDYLGGGATRFAEENLVVAIDSFAELNVRRRRRCRGFFLFATHDNNNNNNNNNVNDRT